MQLCRKFISPCWLSPDLCVQILLLNQARAGRSLCGLSVCVFVCVCVCVSAPEATNN